MKYSCAILLLGLTLFQVSNAFVVSPRGATTPHSSNAMHAPAFTLKAQRLASDQTTNQMDLPLSFLKRLALSSAGFSAGAFAEVGTALADDNLEIAELPPPWVPAIFAVGLLVGVGVLTSSLGDVMSEESSLGLQSGARAKKEIDRSRSSYFKKR